MEQLALQNSEQPIIEIVEETTLPAWHTPTMTRIDIKQTFSGSGAAIDGSSGSLFV